MNQREQRLAMIVMALFIGGGGWIVFNQMGKWRKSIDERAFKLSLQKVEADELMKQKDFWNTRSEWLSQKQEPYKSRLEADNAVYELVEQSAKKNGITLLGKQPQEPEEQPGVVGTSIIVEAKAPLEKVLRWLFELQKPTAFITVAGITLKPNPEDTSIVLVSDLKSQTWYRSVAK